MIEIRIHGRGGQGVRRAAQILGRAAYLAGYRTQDFALYGAERKGAPVTSFVRMDKKAINTRGYVFEPDYIIIIDNTLDMRVCLKGAKAATDMVINCHKAPRGKHVCKVDATGIAIEKIGTPLGANVALLGGFVKIFKPITLEHLDKGVRIELKKYPKELLDKNMAAAKKCYELIRRGK